MSSGFIVYADNLAEIGDSVNDRQSLKGQGHAMDFDCPGADKIDGNVGPGITTDLTRRQFSVMSMNDLRPLTGRAAGNSLIAVESQLGMRHVHGDSIAESRGTSVVKHEMIPVDCMREKRVRNANAPEGINRLSITDKVVLWIFRRKGLQMIIVRFGLDQRH